MPLIWNDETEKQAILRGEKSLPPQREDMPLKYSITIIIVMVFCIACRLLIGF